MSKIPDELRELLEEEQIRGEWWMAAVVAGIAIWVIIIGVIMAVLEVLR